MAQESSPWLSEAGIISTAFIPDILRKRFIMRNNLQNLSKRRASRPPVFLETPRLFGANEVPAAGQNLLSNENQIKPRWWPAEIGQQNYLLKPR